MPMPSSRMVFPANKRRRRYLRKIARRFGSPVGGGRILLWPTFGGRKPASFNLDAAGSPGSASGTAWLVVPLT